MLHALNEARSAGDAAKIINEEVSSGEYGSATYVTCDEKSVIRIENFGTKTYLSDDRQRKLIVTTNHFHNLKEGKKTEDSTLRHKYLETLGKRITEEGLLKLATRHRNPAICRHGRTLSSFIILKRRNEEFPKILYSLEEPCKGYRVFEKRI